MLWKKRVTLPLNTGTNVKMAWCMASSLQESFKQEALHNLSRDTNDKFSLPSQTTVLHSNGAHSPPETQTLLLRDRTNTILKHFSRTSYFLSLQYYFFIDPYQPIHVAPDADSRSIKADHPQPTWHYMIKYLKASNTYPQVFHLNSVHPLAPQ